MLFRAGFADISYEVVVVSGPDATRFLQGQVSQDVVAIRPGSSAFSLLLTPQGKLCALVRILRRSEESLWLIADRGLGEQVAERLRKFKIRVKAEIALERVEGLKVLPSPALCLGPGELDRVVSKLNATESNPRIAGGIGDDEAGRHGSGDELVVIGDLDSKDVLSLGFIGSEAPRISQGGDKTRLSLLEAALEEKGAEKVSAEVAEIWRISRGIPKQGPELGDTTIVQEAGLTEIAVSFDKGCYTGQELVARIDSRGSQVPKRLYGLSGTIDGVSADSPAIVETSRVSLVSNQDMAGTITSAAIIEGRLFVLAYVQRKFNGHELGLLLDGHRVRELRFSPVTLEVAEIEL